MSPTYAVTELLSLRDTGKEAEEEVKVKMNTEWGIRDAAAHSASATPTLPNRAPSTSSTAFLLHLVPSRHLAPARSSSPVTDMAEVSGHRRDLIDEGLPSGSWYARADNSTPLTPHGNALEHVLRSTSVDSTRTVTRPLRSSSAITNPPDGFEPPPNDEFFLRGGKASIRASRPTRFSPTPSMRRGKVAALLRDHASPPGVRVTAGGRLVPDGTTPLTSPRSGHFGKYDQYPQVPHLAPSAVPSTHALRNLDGMIVNVGGNEIAQIVNGQFLHVGYTNSTLSLHVPPTNPVVPSSSPTALTGPLPVMQSDGMPPPSSNGGPRAHAGSMLYGTASTKDKVLESYEAKLAELQIARQKLDREEVLQREHVTPAHRENIVNTRMALTNEISEIRDIIKTIRDQSADVDPYKPAPPLSSHHGAHLPAQMSPYVVPNGYAYQSDSNGMMVGYSSPPAAFYPHFPIAPTAYAGTSVGTTDPVTASYAFAPFNDSHSIGMELQERTTNIGPGDGSNNPAFRPKASPYATENGGMNLDGSVVQPRRSCAVEIKRPDDAAGASKSRLNPASPTYDPARPFPATSPKDTVTDHRATPTVAGKTAGTQKRLTKTDPGPFTLSSGNESFGSSDGAEREPVMESFQTGSTATTADFFPNDPQSHSSRNWSLPAGRESTANLSSWLPKEHELGMDSLNVTPIRSANKYRFNDGDSPDDSPSRISPNEKGSSAKRTDMGSVLRPLKIPSFEGEVPVELGGGSATTSFDSTSHCENLLKHRGSAVFKKSPAKTTSYWSGFNSGLQQNLCEDSDEDYRVGYRDGLLRSKDREPTPKDIFDSNRRDSGAFLPLTEPTRNAFNSSIDDLSRRPSLPSLQLPRVPSNTAVNSPLRQSLENEESLSKASASFDAALLPSNRNNDTVKTGTRAGVGRTSLSGLRSYDPISPLSERPVKNVPRQTSSASKVNFSSRIFSDTTYDQQRYTFKATATSSVAPSADHARGLIPQQLDGSADDDEQPPTKGAQSHLHPNTSPTHVSKGKGRASASSSPIKRASSAVHKLTQISSMSKKATGTGGDMSGDTPPGQLAHPKPKKEEDPAKMSSPEKAKWKSKWRKRFEDIRNIEQKEIEDYKGNNL